tara:strand:+ start:236 stop:406 length:171 start_codon:yes stop_codon:yes gene_type:complete
MLELSLLLFVAAMVCSLIVMEDYPETPDWLDGLTFLFWISFSASVVVAMVHWIVRG